MEIPLLGVRQGAFHADHLTERTEQDLTAPDREPDLKGYGAGDLLQNFFLNSFIDESDNFHLNLDERTRHTLKYLKAEDWAYEQEYRVVVEGEKEFAYHHHRYGVCRTMRNLRPLPGLLPQVSD